MEKEKVVDEILEFDSAIIWEIDKEEYYMCLQHYNGNYDWCEYNMKYHIKINVLRKLLKILKYELWK